MAHAQPHSQRRTFPCLQDHSPGSCPGVSDLRVLERFFRQAMSEQLARNLIGFIRTPQSLACYRSRAKGSRLCSFGTSLLDHGYAPSGPGQPSADKRRQISAGYRPQRAASMDDARVLSSRLGADTDEIGCRNDSYRPSYTYYTFTSYRPFKEPKTATRVR